MKTLAVLGSAAIVILTFGSASAQVPTAADMKSCNEKAKTEIESASASPRMEIERPYVDPPKAEPSKATPPINPNAPSPRPADKERAAGTDATGGVAGAADPQLEGMDAEAGKDAAYRAAYKACMRKGGF